VAWGCGRASFALLGRDGGLGVSFFLRFICTWDLGLDKGRSNKKGALDHGEAGLRIWTEGGISYLH